MSAVDPTEQLKAIASQVISDPDQLEAFMRVADATKWADINGEINADSVSGHLRTLFNVTEQQSQVATPSWGQSSGQPEGGRAGDVARAALEKRHGVKRHSNQPSPDAKLVHGGAVARTALQKRHGVNHIQ